MENLLLTERPITVSRKLAALLGLNQALVLQIIQYALHESWEMSNFNTLFKCTTISNKEWRDYFPFWSEDTIQRSIKNLEKRRLIKIHMIQKMRFYSIDYKLLESMQTLD